MPQLIKIRDDLPPIRVPDGATPDQIRDVVTQSGVLSGSVPTAGRPIGEAPRGEVSRGMSAGVDSLQGSLYGLAALVGDTAGDDTLTNWGLKNYERNQNEAAATGPQVSSLSEIDDFGDFADFASGAIGQAIPSVGVSIGTGGVGGFVGNAVAKRAVTRMVEKGVEKKAAELAVGRAMASASARKQIMSAIKVGAGTGAFLGSAAQQQGDLYGTLREAGIEDAALPAWGFGAVMGGLDVIPEFALAKKLLPDQVEKELTKSFSRGFAKEVGKQAGREAGTEGAQSALSAIARISSGGADWDDTDTQGVLDSMAAGAIVGVVSGGPVDIAARLKNKGTSNEANQNSQEGVSAARKPEAERADTARPVPVRSPAASPAGPTAEASTPQAVADAPSAEPEIDLEAQVRDLIDTKNPRKGVYLSAANIAQHGFDPAQTPSGLAAIQNVDGNGGVMLAKPTDANGFQARLRKGEPREKLIGEFTLSGVGKPTGDQAVIVQQKTAEGAVTAESAVDINDLAKIKQTQEQFAAPGRTVELATPEQTLQRRENIIQFPERDGPHAAMRQEDKDLQSQQMLAAARASGEDPGPTIYPNDPAAALANLQGAMAKFKAKAPTETEDGQLQYDLDEVDRWGEEESAEDEQLGKTDASTPYTYIGVGDRTHGEQRVLSRREQLEGKAKTYSAMPYRGADAQEKTEALAKRRQAQDPDATYVAKQVDEIEAKQMGLSAPGWYVAAYKQPASEMGYASVAGGQRTARQTTQIFISRAKERWDRLSREQKNPQKGDLVYGFRAKVVGPDGNPVLNGKGEETFINIAASELVALGQATDETLRGSDAMSVRDAFREGLRDLILYVDADGNRYQPENFAQNKTTFPRNLVLRDEYAKQDGTRATRMTLGEAHAYAKTQTRATGREAEPFAGETALEAREREVYRGAVDTNDTFTPNTDAPVFDNTLAGDSVDTRGFESEADQNTRSVQNNTGRAQEMYNRPRQKSGDVAAAMSDPARSTSITGIVTDLRDMLKLRQDFFVSDNKEAFLQAMRDAGYEYTADALGAKIDAGGFVGFVAKGTGTKKFIFLNPKYSTRGYAAQQIKTLSHEIGHVFFQQYWNDASPTIRRDLVNEYEKFIELNPKFRIEQKTYEGRFEEWMADQLSAWVAGNKEPRTAVDKWLSDLANMLHAIWNKIRQEYPLNETFNQFVKEVVAKPDNSLDDALSSLGGGNDMLQFDLAQTPEEPSSRMRDVWAKARAIKAKHPRVNSLFDFAGDSIMAMHEGLTASLQARIRRMNIPAFNKIVEQFHKRPGQEGGFTYNAAVANRMRNFIADYDKIVKGIDKAGFMEEMRQEKSIDAISPIHREKAIQFRDLMKRLHAYQREAHMPIAEVQNYFPQIADVEQMLAPDAVDVIFAAMQEKNIEITRQEVAEMVNNYTDDSYALDFDPTKIEDTAGNMRSPFQQALRTRSVPREVREVMHSIKDDKGQSRFFNKDMDETMHRYVREAVRRSEYNRRFGDVTWDEDENLSLGELARPFNSYLQFSQLMDQARREGADPNQQALMFDSMSAFMGQYNRIKSEPLRKLTRSVQFYQNLRTLLLVTFSSIPEIATLFLRTGDFGRTWGVMRASARDAFAKGGDTTKLLRAYGFAVDELDALAFDEFKQARDYNTKLDRANEAWFRAVGLTKWTNFMRGLSLNVSIDYVKEHARRIADGSDTDGDSQRRIDELGLTVADIQTWEQSGEPVYGRKGVSPEDLRLGLSELTAEQIAAAEKVTGAITRLINEMVINPTAAMKPLWRSDERFSLVTQLGSFTYGFVNQVLARVWHELTRDGATTMQRAQVAAAMALMLPLVALGIELKELIQYSMFGKEAPTDEMAAPQYMLTLLSRTGVMGTAQLGIDATVTATNNKSPILAFTGPTISQVSDAFTQPAYKTFPAGIPVISQIPGFREPLRDALK